MIVETNAFRDFDNARKFCCHAGVAPFKYTSGSSIRSRNMVSGMADKSIRVAFTHGGNSGGNRKKNG
jgi:transposase